jgi:hypothetical protein
MSLILDGTSGITQLAGTGTTTNDSAAAGYVGQILTATKARSDFTRLATSTVTNITSISLTAGDWDVWGVAGFLGDAAATATTQFVGSVSTTSATHGANETNKVRITCASVDASTGDTVLPVPVVTLSLAATTTVYLVGNVVFGSSTMTYYGSITARRVR